MYTSIKSFNYKSMHTFRSCVKWSLSAGGLPLLAGYSQSMSKPSKPCFLRYWTEEVANSLLPASVATICVNGALPMFHPPTARRVFNEGFCCLSLLKRSYLSTKFKFFYPTFNYIITKWILIPLSQMYVI